MCAATLLTFLFRYFILYNNFIPISLYVTIEVVKVAQAKLMGHDITMYALTTFPQYVFVTLETCTPPGWTV